MAITYLPTDLLKKLAPKGKAAKIINDDLSINEKALRALDKLGILSKKKLDEIALKVARQYKDRYKDERDDGQSVEDAQAAASNDNALLVQRIQDATIFEVAKEIKSQYRGEFYEWLPSDADVPDPIHQLNYGKIFQIGVGDPNGQDPGDRYGCKCGMRIIVDATELEL